MKYLVASLLLFSFLISFSQTKKLHRNISNGLDQEMVPRISADGNAIAFLYKPNRGGAWKVHYARKKNGKWGRSEELTIVNKQIRLIQFGGFSLNEDGSVLYFSSKKYGGVGGYDLWQTTRKSHNEWSAPTNLYKPINTSENECSPSLTADGNLMYFTRCASVSSSGADCCAIYVSERKGQSWGVAKPLPSSINKGCETSPFIHPDGKTLYFSSDRTEGKGKLDLYLSKKSENGIWSKPMTLDFLNSEKDDQFITMDAREHIIYYAQKKAETYDLYAVIIEDKYRAEPLLKIRIRLKDKKGSRIDGYLRIKDLGSNSDLFVKKIDDTDYQTNIYLSGKGDYDFTIYGVDDRYFFFSEEFNLDTLEKYRYVKRQIVLSDVKKGGEYPIHLYFDKDNSLTVFSKEELLRVKRLISKHLDKKFTLEIRTPVIEQIARYDTTMRDITNLMIDTIKTDLVEQEVAITLDQTILIAQKHNIRNYCDEIGLTEKRIRVNIRAVEGLKENRFFVLIK